MYLAKYIKMYYCAASKSDEVESQGKDDKCKSDPLGSLCKLCVERLSLALGQESVSAAGDSTGETSTLAALEQNDDSKGNTGKNLDNSKNDSK